MNTGKIVALREMLTRIESAEKLLDEARVIARRAYYSDHAEPIERINLDVEKVKHAVERHLLDLEQFETEFGLRG